MIKAFLVIAFLTGKIAIPDLILKKTSISKFINKHKTIKYMCQLMLLSHLRLVMLSALCASRLLNLSKISLKTTPR